MKDLGYALPEPFIVILLFKGLFSSFELFISCKYEEIANKLKFNKASNKRAEGALLVNILKLIADIISKESRFSAKEDSLANKAFKNIAKGKAILLINVGLCTLNLKTLKTRVKIINLIMIISLKTSLLRPL